MIKGSRLFNSFWPVVIVFFVVFSASEAKSASVSFKLEAVASDKFLPNEAFICDIPDEKCRLLEDSVDSWGMTNACVANKLSRSIFGLKDFCTSCVFAKVHDWSAVIGSGPSVRGNYFAVWNAPALRLVRHNGSGQFIWLLHNNDLRVHTQQLGWRSPVVLKFKSDGHNSAARGGSLTAVENFNRDKRAFNFRQSFFSDSKCRLSGGGSRFGFSQHTLGVISRPARMMKGSEYRIQSECSKHDSSGCRPEHLLSPIRHLFLSLKVALFAALLGLGSYLVFFSYQVADRGFDIFERGRKIYGLGVLVFAAFLGVGSAFFLPWLVFSSDLAPSLP